MEKKWERVDRSEARLPNQLSGGEVAVHTVVAIGLVIADAATHHLISNAAHVAGLLSSNKGNESGDPDPVIPADLHLSAAPQLDSDGAVACTACQRRVAYASMVLNEYGYFCSTCGDLKPSE